MGRRKRPSLPFFPLPIVPCPLYFALFSASLEHKEASAQEGEDRPLKAQIRLLSSCHQNTPIYLFIYLCIYVFICFNKGVSLKTTSTDMNKILMNQPSQYVRNATKLSIPDKLITCYPDFSTKQTG